MIFIKNRPIAAGCSLFAICLFVSTALGRMPLLGGLLAAFAQLGLLIAICLILWGVYRAWRASQALHTAKQSGDPSDSKKLFFKAADGAIYDALPFMNARQNLFGRPFQVIYMSDRGERVIIQTKALSPKTPDDVFCAQYILHQSALAERAKRGYRILDQDGALIGKGNDDDVLPDGFIVEQLEADDGSQRAVVAYDVADSLGLEDYAAAVKLGLGGQSHFFDHTTDGFYCSKNFGSPAWLPPAWAKGRVPLCKVQLKTVLLKAASADGNPFRPRSTEKGAAQFAWFDEINQANAVVPKRPDSTPAGALLGTFNESDWLEGAPDRLAPIFTTGEGHRMIVGSPGSGKFTAAIAPLLLSADASSVFVFDVADGEAARRTAGWRSTLGPVLVLDPFGVSGLPSGALNPLDYLKADDPDVLQAAKRLADAIFVPGKGGENADYFNEQAREVLTAYLLHVATDMLETDRTLRRVRELIRRPIDSALLTAMEANEVAGGMVRDTAANLKQAVLANAEKNTFFVTQTLRASTAFLDLPAVIRATATTTFDPAELRERVSTLYVCLPEAELGQVGRWLRLIYTTIMGRVRRAGGVPLQVAIDEFPALGRFNLVRDDMALVRKFGIQLHIVTQSLVQLEGIYDKDWQSFMANAKYQQLLGANDHMTTEYFSKRLGMTTRRGTSSSQSRSEGGGSQSSSDAWHADALLSPDELGRLDRNELIVVVEGMNPLRLRKANYYELPRLKERADLPIADQA